MTSPTDPQITIDTDRPPPLLTRKQLSVFLKHHGFCISHRTLGRLCMPSNPPDTGPPTEYFWGNVALHDPAKALSWAKRRAAEMTVAKQSARG